MLNIAAYHFVAIEDPAQLRDTLRECAESLSLKGSVLIAPEGINLFLAGADESIGAFLDLLRADVRFADLRVKTSVSDQQPFQRLKFKIKREIISFRREGVLPIGQRAPSLPPRELLRWLRAGRDDAGRELVLLDTRNRCEIEHGTFENALCLPIDRFTDLPAAMEAERGALAGKTIVSFCTGGIRCEKAALWMQQAGFDNVWQLEGGILDYFEQVGGEGYAGNCFVFDERVALTPALKPVATG